MPREIGESFPWRYIILSHLELSAMYSGEFILGTIPSPYIQQWQGLDVMTADMNTLILSLTTPLLVNGVKVKSLVVLDPP